MAPEKSSAGEGSTCPQHPNSFYQQPWFAGVSSCWLFSITTALRLMESGKNRFSCRKSFAFGTRKQCNNWI